MERLDAKPNTRTYYIACYGYYPYSRVLQPIDCDFTLWVSYPPHEDSDPQVNGGHLPAGNDATAGPRPLLYRQRHFLPGSQGPIPIYDDPGKLQFDFDRVPDENLRVEGETMPTGTLLNEARVVYPVPEVSGEAQVDVQIKLPPGFICITPCYTDKISWYRDTLHFGLYTYIRPSYGPYAGVVQPALVELPDPGPDDHYVKSRTTPDLAHPNSVAFYIKPEHIPQLRVLANWYYKHTDPHRALSLNDMTLLSGGLFDICPTASACPKNKIPTPWAPPHRTHRDDTDADVNQYCNGVRIKCRDDKELIKAARAALPNLRDKFGTGGNTDSALLCESGGVSTSISSARQRGSHE